MNQEKYVAPGHWKIAFHCPRCNVHANQRWYRTFIHESGKSSEIGALKVAYCSHCAKFSFWIDGRLVYPRQITAPLAHGDMPESVLEYYNEAREVSVSSPRAAAALLRLAAKKLCESLGENDPNLNRAIGNLHKRGLSQSVIQSLDTVRIVGNEGGAHEGQIDLTGEDSKEVVDKLFWLVNFIIEKTITEPKEVQGMFSALPEDKKQGVEDRDKHKD